MKIDVSKTAQANLLALVNLKGAQAVTADQVTFSAASTNSSGSKNTVVTLTAVSGKGFSGTVDLRYNRLGLDKGVASPNTTLVVAEGSSTTTLLTQAASQLGLREDQIEWASGTTVPADGQSSQATLQAKSSSYLYVGTLQLTLDNPAEPVALSSNYGDGELDGFDAA